MGSSLHQPAPGYRDFLSSPGAARLLTASIVARLPLGMASLAILLLVREQTHSYSAAGGAVGALALSQAVVAPLQGRLISRTGPTRILLSTCTAQVVVLVALVVVVQQDVPLAVLLVLSGLAGACMPPATAAARMLWSHVIGDPRRRSVAYSLDATAQEVVWTTGPLTVGVVVSLTSTSTAVLVTAAVSAAGTAWFATSPEARAVVGSSGPRPRADNGGALSSLWIVGLLLGASLGALEVGLTGLVDGGAAAGQAGLLVSLWSIGSMVGGVVSGAVGWRSSHTTRLALTLVASALLALPLLAADGLALGLPGAFLAGLPGAAVFSSLSSLLDDRSTLAGKAEAFAWNTAALVSGVAGGSAVAGTLLDHHGFDATVLLSAGAALGAALVTCATRGLLDGARTREPGVGAAHEDRGP